MHAPACEPTTVTCVGSSCIHPPPPNPTPTHLRQRLAGRLLEHALRGVKAVDSCLHREVAEHPRRRLLDLHQQPAARTRGSSDSAACMRLSRRCALSLPPLQQQHHCAHLPRCLVVRLAGRQPQPVLARIQLVHQPLRASRAVACHALLLPLLLPRLHAHTPAACGGWCSGSPPCT